MVANANGPQVSNAKSSGEKFENQWRMRNPVFKLLLASCESNSGLVSFLQVLGRRIKARKTSYKLHWSYWNNCIGIFLPKQRNRQKKYLIHNLFDCHVTQLLVFFADIEKWVSVSKALPVLLCVKQPSIKKCPTPFNLPSANRKEITMK